MSEIVWFKGEELTEKLQLAELLGLLGISIETATEQQIFNAKVLVQNLALYGVEFKTIRALLADIVGTVSLRFSPRTLMEIQLPMTALDLKQ